MLIGHAVFSALFSLVLTEVGANPPGSESGAGSPGDRYEFVELWNPGPDTLNLAGLVLDDGDEADTLVAWQDSTLLDRFPGLRIGTLHLAPGGYAVVLDPEIVDSLEGVPFDLPEGTLVLRPQDTDLGNGLANTDPVGLRDASGWLSTYGLDPAWADTGLLNPPDGVSVERRDPLGPDDPHNFRLCRWQATPGRRNSWSLDHDLGLVADSLAWHPGFPAARETLQLRVALRNYGLQATEQRLWVEFGDKTLSRLVSIAPDEQARVSLAIPAPEAGVHALRLALEPDDFPGNDSLRRTLVVDLGPVVINEIQPYGTPEWIEVLNTADTTVSLEGWFLRDASGHTSGTIQVTLPPGGYRVLTGSAEFATRWPGVPHEVLADWPTLNDEGDTLYLCDSLGTPWDAVPYLEAWGGSATRSLERVSPTKPARYAWNWQPCRDPAGGTPGARNSVYINPEAGGPGFRIPEPVVRPRGVVALEYRLQDPLDHLEVRLFDSTGRRIGRVFSGDRLGTFGAISWTAPETPGLYLVLLRYESGGKKRVAKTTFVVQPR